MNGGASIASQERGISKPIIFPIVAIVIVLAALVAYTLYQPAQGPQPREFTVRMQEFGYNGSSTGPT